VNEGIVAFRDQSQGTINSRQWTFGDGTTSTEQNRIHQYKPPPGTYGNYTVILDLPGIAGTSERPKSADSRQVNEAQHNTRAPSCMR
jgi:hypothetical protein